MSKRITAAATPKLKRTDTSAIRDHAGTARSHKVNKTPCSLCHQVVEELKYHYDICEPCHQSEWEESDMDVEQQNEEPSTPLLSDDDSQPESDGWESCEEKGTTAKTAANGSAENGKSVKHLDLDLSMVQQDQPDSKSN